MIKGKKTKNHASEELPVLHKKFKKNAHKKEKNSVTISAKPLIVHNIDTTPIIVNNM